MTVHRLTPEESAELHAAIERGDSQLIVCWSRCLWCGRKTPHEVCHEHSRAFDPTEEEMAALEGWPGFNLDPEQCGKSDEECYG